MCQAIETKNSFFLFEADFEHFSFKFTLHLYFPNENFNYILIDFYLCLLCSEANLLKNLCVTYFGLQNTVVLHWK